MKLKSYSWMSCKEGWKGTPEDRLEYECDEEELRVLETALKAGLFHAPGDTLDRLRMSDSDVSDLVSLVENAMEQSPNCLLQVTRAQAILLVRVASEVANGLVISEGEFHIILGFHRWEYRKVLAEMHFPLVSTRREIAKMLGE